MTWTYHVVCGMYITSAATMWIVFKTTLVRLARDCGRLQTSKQLHSYSHKANLYMSSLFSLFPCMEAYPTWVFAARSYL